MRLWCCGICARCAYVAEPSSTEQSFQILTSFLFNQCATADGIGSYRGCQCCMLNARVAVTMDNISTMLNMYTSASGTE